MLDQVTPLILTLDEGPNIERTLARLSWARNIVVVDSYSSDDTIEIVKRHANTRLFQRKFDAHADQWNFGLKETGIETDWVLALDADYVVPDELTKEISALVPPDEVDGYQASFRYCVEGRPLRGTVYPPVAVLFRRARGKYVQDGHTQKLRVPGRVMRLATPIYHDDRKSLRRWINSQSRYMQLEAANLLKSHFFELPLQDKVRRLILVAPIAMFVYCLLIKGNIFDGRAGMYYALQRSVAEGILSLYLLRAALLPGGHRSTDQ